MDKIIDNLYLGDLQSASNIILLKRNVKFLIFISLIYYYRVSHIFFKSQQRSSHSSQEYEKDI